jgi:hypothetical protein
MHVVRHTEVSRTVIAFLTHSALENFKKGPSGLRTKGIR